MRIMIVGANSYIGKSFERWCNEKGGDFQFTTLDPRDPDWDQTSFSGYDVILHVAGIAHRKKSEVSPSLYYEINRDLAFNVACCAKEAKVKRFVFLSSMSVYGIDSGQIDQSTSCNPKSHYGKSKIEAETEISKLISDDFHLTIVRPPIVYGKDCKGNYQTLRKIALNSPVFPNIINQRSMIHIDNLCEFLKISIENDLDGVFYPQNREYVATQQMVMGIANINSKNIYLSKLAGVVVRVLKPYSKLLQKAFGDLTYEKGMSIIAHNYQIRDFEESMKLTELGK